jgi:hypothetical protein
MASTINIKQALAASATLRDRIVWEGLLELVEQVKSRDPLPDPRLHGTLVLDFFQRRENMANTVAGQAKLDADGAINYDAISSLGAIRTGFASDLVDRAVADAGANPWEAVPDGGEDAAAAAVVASLTRDQIYGGTELSFNGLAGVKRLHMEAVIAAGLWSHPFGLPE